jgi:hypothetical protein
MLLRPRQPEREMVESPGLRLEVRTQISQSKQVTRSTSESYRGLGVYSAGRQGAYDEIRGQAVNVTSAIAPVGCAINVRPPPDLLQSGTRANPGKCRGNCVTGRCLVYSGCLCCTGGRSGGRVSARALFSSVSRRCLGSRGRSY